MTKDTMTVDKRRFDIESGEYELADDSLTALDRLKVKHPDAPTYILRVDYPTAVRIGVGCRIQKQ